MVQGRGIQNPSTASMSLALLTGLHQRQDGPEAGRGRQRQCSDCPRRRTATIATRPVDALQCRRTRRECGLRSGVPTSGSAPEGFSLPFCREIRRRDCRAPSIRSARVKGGGGVTAIAARWSWASAGNCSDLRQRRRGRRCGPRKRDKCSRRRSRPPKLPMTTGAI